MAAKLSISLKKSRIGRSKYQKLVLDGLGLRKINQKVVLVDNKATRGMINKVAFMLEVKEAE